MLLFRLSAVPFGDGHMKLMQHLAFFLCCKTQRLTKRPSWLHGLLTSEDVVENGGHLSDGDKVHKAEMYITVFVVVVVV